MMRSEQQHAFPRSWYPLCRSTDLKRGQIIARHAFGHKLAVFRTQQNQLGAVDSRCCHIGADLSRGFIDDDFLVCPLHNWAYDVQGKCQRIPCGRSQEEIPVRAKQPALYCQEHYGVVYGFLGDSPDFPLPYFPDTENYIASNVRIIEFDAPYEMAGANSFDEQHLAAVHRRQVIGEQQITSLSPNHFAIEYRANVAPHTLYDKFLHLIGKSRVHMALDCWGGNLLLFKHIGTANQMIISLLPVNATQSRAFITTVLAKRGNRLLRPFQWSAVRLLNIFTMLFVKQDVKALQDIDFAFTTMLPEADNTMIKWYQYWKRLPRNTLTGSNSTTVKSVTSTVNESNPTSMKPENIAQI